MKKIIKSLLPAFVLMITSVGSFAQDAAAAATDAGAESAAEAAPYSPYTDPIFYGLAVVALVLLIFIMQLQKVFASVAQNYSKGGTGTLKALLVLVAVTQMSTSSYAANDSGFFHEGFGSNAMNAIMFIILAEVAIVLYYVRLLRLFLMKEEEVLVAKGEVVPAKPSFWEKFNNSVAVEKEAAIMTDHDYDGIQELDNSLPPWWKYGFYFTIVWAVVYLAYFHVTNNGPSSAQEYKNELAQAEIEMAAYRAKAANLIDETNVVLLTEAADIEKGKATFTAQCVACHGAFGEGKVGPNLTDQYWKHGGDIKDLFKTIKMGVPGTGMKSWKTDLNPTAMAQVASYILTLQGTNPAGAKAAEGELYTPAGAAPAAADSTGATAPADTTVTAAK